MKEKEGKGNWVRVIGAFKLAKGLLLLALACGAFSLIHKDLAAQLIRWIHKLNFDPNAKYAQMLLGKALPNAGRLPIITGALLAYGAIFSVEGIGLILEKRWAEYLTVIVTSSFLPLELYEIIKHASALKGVVMALNIAIVIYLIAQLRRVKDEKRPDRSGTNSAPKAVVA